MTEEVPPRTLHDGAPRWRRPRRRTVVAAGVVALLVGGAVTVFSLQEGHTRAEVLATQPVQRGWGLYLGTVPGLTVGIATNGRTVQAFARNADASEVSWFDGPFAGSSFDITAANGSVLAAAVVGGIAHGRYVTASGAVVPFDVPAPVAQGALYRGAVVNSDGVRIDAGWVVSETGTVTGGVVVSGPRGTKRGPTRPITATLLETAGTAETSSGIVPLRRVRPETLDQPVATALTGASLGNKPGRRVVKDEISTPVKKVDVLTEPAIPSGVAISAQLTGPATVEQGSAFEVKLALANPDPVAVDGAAIDLAFPAAFAMGDRPDEAIPKGCVESKILEATTVADDDVTPNGNQLIGRNIALSPGGTCELAIDLTAKEVGVYELVTSPGRAPGRPAAPPGRLTVTVVAPRVKVPAATAGDPQAVPNGICAVPSSSADGPNAVVSNVSLGASPLPVRFSTTGLGQASTWTMKFSDGTPSITCNSAPPAMIPHTFINFADPTSADPVVFTAELTAIVKGKTVGPLRVLIEVYPRVKDAKSRRIATLVSPTNEAFVRGTNSTASVEVLNAADEDLEPGTTVSISIVTDAGAAVGGTLAPAAGPWTCTTPQSCRFDGPIGKLASPPPLRLTVGVPAPGPSSYKVTAVVDAVTSTSNSAAHVDRTAVVPVEGVIARASTGGRLRPLEQGTVTAPVSVALPGGGVAINPAGGLLPPEPPPPPPQFPSLTLNKDGKLAPTTVTLDGRASIHGQRPTTYHWEQVRGPTDPVVTLGNGGTSITDTFSAPIVLAPTELVFKLTAADTRTTDDDTISITITPVNRAPAIKVDTGKTAPTGERLPDAGKAFNIAFSAKDPDGEAVTVTWRIDTPVPAGAVVVNESKLTIPTWPIADTPQVVAIATATDSRGLVTTKTVLIGVKPLPPRLTVSGPVGVQPGGKAQINVVDATRSTTAFVWELADGSAAGAIENTTSASAGVNVDPSATPGTALVIRVHPQGRTEPIAELEIPVLPTPVTLSVPPISVPDSSCIDVAISSFPAIPLPGDFVFVSGSITNCNGSVHVIADANGPAGSTVHIDGTQFADGFAGKVRFTNLALLGGTVTTDAAGADLDTRNGGRLTLTITNANLGIPGLTLTSAQILVSAGGLAVHAEARIGDPAHAFDVNIDGTLAQAGTFALAISAKNTGSVTLHPELPTIDSAQFVGSLEWDGVALHFRLSAAVNASWSPATGVAITGLRVELGNVDPPATCPTDGLFLAVAGTASVDANLTPDPIALSIEGCLGLPGSSGSGADGAQPFFRIDSNADLGNWRPLAGVDLVVKGVGITIQYAGNDLSLDVHGDATVLGVDVEVHAQVGTAPPAFIVVASANLVPIGIPLDHAVLAFSTAPRAQFDLDLDGNQATGTKVDLPAGLTAIAEMAVPNVDMLNKVLNPEKKSPPPAAISPTAVFLANVSDAGITLKAQVSLGASGLTLLKLCSAGVFDQCNSMLDATTEVRLTGFELGLVIGASGLELSASVLGTMLLPKRNAQQTSSSTDPRLPAIDIGATVFVAPPVVGFSMFVKGPWTNPFGIDGFTITKSALQLSLDFTVPNAPIPSIGILLEAQGLPAIFEPVLHQTKQETVRLAVNISKTAPIFEMTLGNHGDGTFLKPHPSLELDDASLVIAPLGGKIGPFTYTPGIHLSFGGKIFSLVVDGTFDVTLTPPKISGHLDVGALPLGPLTIEETELDLVVDPTAPAFCARARGGVAIDRGGPRFAASVTFVAAGSACAGFPAPPSSGVAISGSMTAQNWTLAPGVKLTNINIQGSFAGLDNPNFELGVAASANVLGGNRSFSGSLRFKNGIVDRFSLSIDVGTVPVGPVIIECNSGPCLTINYDANVQPRVQVAVHGKVTVGATAMSVAIDGVLDTTHVAMTAVLSAGTSKINGISLTGELFFASDPDARIINASGQSVVAQPGDFRLTAKTVDAIQLGSTTAKWVFAVGRAGGAFYVNGSADLQVFEAVAHVSGDFKISSGKLSFHVEGTSGGEVDTAKHSLNLVERTAIRAALPNAGHYDQGLDVGAKLVFRADYKFKVILDSGTGLSVSADGSTSLRYVEYPNGEAEKRAKQTTLADGKVDFNSSTGRFCYSVTIVDVEYSAGSC